LVSVTPQGILRSLNLAQLDISPVWYNPVTGKLRVYEQLEVTVTFTNADLQATIQLKKDTYSPYFTNLYSQIGNSKQIPDSLITSAPVTYVIIADHSFHNPLQSFINWKKKKGFNVIVGYTNNPAVGTTTATIKNYLQNLYNNPPTGYQKPSFVLFAGDINLIPYWTTNSHPSDMYYCDYTGDNIPDVFYGRFGAQDTTQLRAYLDKAMEYEQYTMPSDAFLGEVTMVAGSDPTNGPLYGNGQINYGTNNYFNSAHSILSHTYLQPQPTGEDYPAEIHQNVSNGVAFANYTAHGSEDGWANPEFVIADISPLQNDHKYCLMVGNCCKTSNFGSTCFAKEVTKVPHKGALGYIGCSDYSYWDEDYWWACGFKTVSTNPSYDPQHLGAYDVTFHDRGESTSKWFVTMGQMVAGGQLAVQGSSSGIKLYYWETYCLMGDPSLSVYYSIPQQVTASFPATTIVGISTLTVNTEPYAYVALSVHDTTLLAAKCADTSGIVILNFNALTSTDPLSIVVTKQNRKPLIGTIQVVPATSPYVVLSSYVVNDSIGGNNNHLADYGEQIHLNVTLQNIGVQRVSGVTGTLSTSDPNITITSATFNFDSIAAGGTTTGLNAYAITVNQFVEDQHQVSCNLHLTDGINEWNSSLILILNAPFLTPGAVTVLDPLPGGNNNGILDPGESATLKIAITNTGHASSCNTIGHLTIASSSAPYILVSNPNYYLGTLGTGTPSYSYFPITTNGITPIGTQADMNYKVTGGMMSQYSGQDSLHLVIGQTPEYDMGNTTTTTCNGTFYDSGGPNGNYNDNEDYIYTFNPGSTGAKIQAVFSAFAVEDEPNCNYDWVKVFNGPDTASSLLGTYCGSTIPGPFTSSNGPLTFQFHSDYSVNLPGWAASISCTGGPLSLAANAFPSDVCLGSSSQLAAIPSGGSGSYTYQWNPSTYLDNPTSRTPISTPSSNISYTVTVNDGNSSLTSSAVALTIHALPLTPVITFMNNTLSSNASCGNQWYLNYAFIPGATSQYYTPLASGLYYVIVSDTLTGCSSLPSNSINFLFTGLDQHSDEETVNVYPNPFRNKFNISYETSESGNVRISLLDMFGKEVRIIQEDAKQTSGKHIVEMQAEDLKSGIYIVRIQTQSYSVLKKVLLTE
jgi:hypothetical protein